MGKISEIYSSYKKSLDKSQSDYERSVKGTSENSKQLYDDFFKKMIINYGRWTNSTAGIEHITDKIIQFFRKDVINFVAVDGSLDKHQSSEFISFYGGAYGSRGELILSHSPPKR